MFDSYELLRNCHNQFLKRHNLPRMAKILKNILEVNLHFYLGLLILLIQQPYFSKDEHLFLHIAFILNCEH